MLRSLVGSEMCIRDRIYSNPGEGFQQDVTAKCLTYVEVFVLSSEVLLNAFQTFPIFAVQVEKSSPHPLELVAEDGTIIGSTEESQAAKELKQFELLRSGRNAVQAHPQSTFLAEDERPVASSSIIRKNANNKANIDVLSDDTRKEIDAFMFAVSDGDSDDEDDDEHDRNRRNHHHHRDDDDGKKAKTSSTPTIEDRPTTSPCIGGSGGYGGGACDIVQPSTNKNASQHHNNNTNKNQASTAEANDDDEDGYNTSKVVEVSDLLSREQSANTPKNATATNITNINNNRNDSMVKFAPQTPQVVIGASRKLRKTDSSTASGTTGSMVMGRPLSPTTNDNVDQGVLVGGGGHASTVASTPGSRGGKPSVLNANLLSQPAQHHHGGGGANTTMSLLSPNPTLRRDGSSLLTSESSHVGGRSGPRSATFQNQGGGGASGPFLNPFSAANNSVVASRAASNLKLRDSDVIVADEQPSSPVVVSPKHRTTSGDDRRGTGVGGGDHPSARGSRRASAVTVVDLSLIHI
eukprot:TRINITY_DN4575_c0_g2_i1.p1 TRINITY_DN4575_c0_g2~~TRINITY_DN4575_c0_g2_i1.p1  ORF type:complete len:521 (+),score=114.14 TRINITY_DN4575_c0_g2_i1:165-1727(+)